VTAVLWALVLLPTVAGAVLTLLPTRIGRSASVAGVGVAAVVVLLSGVVAAARPSVAVPCVAGASFGLAVDGLAALVAPTLAAVTLLALVFAAGDVRESQPRFHGLMLLFAAAALVTVTATSLPTLLFAWEVMGATSYALIGFWWREERRVASGLVAFVTTRAGDLGLYLAAGAALAAGTGLGLLDMAHGSAPWRDVMAAGVVAAALGKAAQLPFSFWPSRAMDGPSPVSALLHSAAMVAMGGYLLLRTAPLLHATTWAGPVVAWGGVLTAVALGAVAVAQDDLKHLLAASTSAQLGFVVLAAGVSGVSGGGTQLVAHAATKALLFLVAGAWLGALGTKRLSALSGVARRWRPVGIAATIGALSLAGLPPLALWATKDSVLAAALRESVALYVAGLVGAVLSAAYAAKVLVVIWRPLPDDAEAGYDAEEQGSRSVGPLLRLPLVPLALGALTLEVLALPPVDEAMRGLLGVQEEPAAGGWELTVSAALAVLAVLLVARTRWLGRLERSAVLRGWLGLETLAHRVLVRPTLWLARGLAGFDDRVLDRSVVRTGTATVALARRVGALDVRAVDGAVQGVAGGVRRLGALARRPQTGLLHQYYIQAVSAVAAAVVVLVVVR
jgi:NADH:ubiquinone oxidoreductase subunit 5 (subunit L)/multisubunit Na+/H+ antiporter MnhA subunit